MIQRNGRKKALILVALFIFGIIIQCYTFLSIANDKVADRVKDAQQYGRDFSNYVRLTLEKSVESSESLKHFYAVYEDACFDNFDTIASQIMDSDPAIQSVYIAPKGVIEEAYPEAVRATTIGFNMLEDEKQGPRAQLAIDTQTSTVAGPHNLIEGGQGLIIRNPLFQDGKFIGFAIVILDWDTFIEEVMKNAAVSSSTYKLALWKDDHDDTAITDQDGYIYKNTNEDISQRVNIKITVPNDIWHLVVEPVQGWEVYGEMTQQISVSIIVFLALMILCTVLFTTEQKRITLSQENIAKTNFLNNMSHDIRTPMNAILGFTRLMERDIDDKEKVKKYLKKMEISSEYLLSLINNMLEVARIDSGKESVDESFVDLMDEKGSVVPLFEDEIKKKKLKFTRSMKVEHRYVFTDMRKTMEITMNLLSNAVKYTPEGGHIHMQFDEVPCDKEGYGKYLLIISDNGIGMSEEFQEHIFESFSRERNSTEGKVLGTGLGMSIVKKLVDLMGGSIEVESKVGYGTTFRVYQYHRIVEDPETYIQEMHEAISAQQIDLTGRNILIAEDNELNAEIAQAILEEIGAQVELARDGVECVNMIMDRASTHYDLILMDIQMPYLNGYDATRRIRALSDPIKANIPILAMTANAFDEDKENAMEAGMDGHLAKPIDVSKLMVTLSDILKSKPISLMEEKRQPEPDHVEGIFEKMKSNPILSLIPGGFFAYEAYGQERLIYANGAACEIWGCQSYEELEEFCKGSFKGMVHPDDYDRIEASIWEQVAQGDKGNDQVVYRIIRKDGSVRLVDDYGHLEKDEEFGDIFYVFVADRTEKYN